MQVVNATNPTPCVATIGFFDGVHRGHRFLIEQVRAAAMERGLASAVLTFPVHPRQVMQADYRPSLLLTRDEKTARLGETGIELCFMMDFTRELSQLTAAEFMALIRDRLSVRALVIGYDHRFGHGRTEGFTDYVRHGRELGIEVIRAEAYVGHAGAVSSSMVRRLLAEGDVAAAAQCLGRDYELSGTVVSGYGRGRTIGYPTANLCVDDADKLIPADGVYAARAIHDGHTYAAMMNIGFHPTTGTDGHRTIEVHLLDYAGSLYGHRLSVALVSRLRTEQCFATATDLARQLCDDEQRVRAMVQVG